MLQALRCSILLGGIRSAFRPLILYVCDLRHTVTVNGSYAQTGGTDVYTEGATVSIDAGTRAGYTFDGWTSSDGVTFADANSAQTTFTMPGKPVTVTASWVPNSSEVGDQEFVRYIVQHYKQNTDGSYRLEDAEYPIGEVGDTVTATASNYEGYTYNAEKSNASGTLTEIKSDADIVTLKLYYDLTVFTVTVETSGNGTASASPASATMGQTVTLTAKAASGYHFVKWEVVSGDIVLNGNIFTMPAGNVTVKAVFERTSSGGGGWTQQKPVPQTGDNSNIGLWISLCALSLAGLVGTSIWYAARRRRYETEASSHPLIP